MHLEGDIKGNFDLVINLRDTIVVMSTSHGATVRPEHSIHNHPFGGELSEYDFHFHI